MGVAFSPTLTGNPLLNTGIMLIHIDFFIDSTSRSPTIRAYKKNPVLNTSEAYWYI
jgi:hypothetical protein